VQFTTSAPVAPHSELCVAVPESTARIPEGVSFVTAACAYWAVTPYRGILGSGLRYYDDVAVFGLGPLGLCAVQLLRPIARRCPRCPPPLRAPLETAAPRTSRTRTATRTGGETCRSRPLQKRGAALMAAFVLVHGSFHGGWCWRRVAPLLRAAGHPVYTPTLTGSGERVHLASPQVGLSTHIQDVVNVLVYEDLRDVILVGHSSGGRVISGVADRVPERLTHLVYLDAPILHDGECGLDLYRPEAQAALRERVRSQGEGWYQPVPDAPRWGISDPADWAWVRPKLVPQTFKALTEPIRLTGAGAALPGTLILCTADAPPGSPAAAEAAPVVARAHARGYRYRELATGHDAMITAPQALAALLLEVA
jgi:pimeloyl-ACP methyl ester carboxylesterase